MNFRKHALDITVLWQNVNVDQVQSSCNGECLVWSRPRGDIMTEKTILSWLIMYFSKSPLWKKSNRNITDLQYWSLDTLDYSSLISLYVEYAVIWQIMWLLNLTKSWVVTIWTKYVQNMSKLKILLKLRNKWHIWPTFIHHQFLTNCLLGHTVNTYQDGEAQ